MNSLWGVGGEVDLVLQKGIQVTQTDVCSCSVALFQLQRKKSVCLLPNGASSSGASLPAAPHPVSPRARLGADDSEAAPWKTDSREHWEPISWCELEASVNGPLLYRSSVSHARTNAFL